MPKSGPGRSVSGRIAAVDSYVAQSAEFAQPILRHLRDVVHEAVPDVVEEMKWSRPFFVYQGVILGNIAAFKEHCSFGLWGGEVADKLRAEGVASGEAMGTFGRITDVGDLPSRKKMVEYVQHAGKMIAEGVHTKAWSRPRVAKPEATVPDALAKALKANKPAAAKFAAMTPSCRREYIQWIDDAKREETRQKRVATAMEWIAEGKSRNWKYESTAS